ncbi:MAG TPA: DUF134 domain-containing protein [archaeon]|nr:DUF134 domain-containing protein [archaeon]
MSRPRLFRRIGSAPCVIYFKPAGIRLIGLEKSIITIDEFESVKLKDFFGMEQEKCAQKMGISQPTFHRLVLSARKKIADAIVNGKALRIEGGNTRIMTDPEKQFHCVSCGHEWIVNKEKASVCPKCKGKKIHSHASCKNSHVS